MNRRMRNRLSGGVRVDGGGNPASYSIPQHASECHQDSAVTGYVDYALYRGASLKVDIGDGRFVFFYLPVDF